jgi:glycosyltransferase involved in cell wall biosynthesis
MRLTVVMGFFLPMPPVAGGAVEKSWHMLAQEMVRLGHEVTLVSRRWRDWPADETVAGVRHLRIAGFDHRRRLWQNLLCDLIWSWRAYRQLPASDVVVLNTISLGCWLGRCRPEAGRVVLMVGRQPKGQFRLYSRLARILVPSTGVQAAIARERPAHASLVRVVGYPIDWRALSRPRSNRESIVTLGFVGRLHREKGLDLLAAATGLLAKRQDLPPWRMLICGPADVARGGSGDAYLDELKRRLPPQANVVAPQFETAALHELYRQFEIFCYPSLASHGETFGVAVAEAMAAGAVPVVSDLPCFRDFITPGTNGLAFNASATEAAATLAAHLADLIVNGGRRGTLAAAAQASVACYDTPAFAARLLADFAQLTEGAEPPSSHP